VEISVAEDLALVILALHQAKYPKLCQWQQALRVRVPRFRQGE